MAEKKLPGWTYMPNGRIALHRAAKIEAVAIIPAGVAIGADIVSSPDHAKAIAAGLAKPDRLQIVLPLPHAKILVETLQRQISVLEQPSPPKNNQH